LSERVDELEATLTEKTERIDALSKRRSSDSLTNSLPVAGKKSQGEHVSTANENGAESESSSMLSRLFGGRFE